MVDGQRHRHQRARGDGAVADDGLLRRGADSEDRRLRRVEHGGELLDPEHPEVGDRKGAALEVALGQLAVACALDEVGTGRGRLGEREPLGLPDDGDHEARRRGDGEADVRGREAQERLLGELDVDVAVAHQRHRGDLRQQVGDGDAHAGVELARAFDELVRERHVGGDGELEDGHLPRRRQPPRDRLADPRQRHRLDPLGPLHFRHGAWHRTGLLRPCLGALDVLRDDASLRTGPLERGQLDSAFARDSPGERARLDAIAAVRLWMSCHTFVTAAAARRVRCGRGGRGGLCGRNVGVLVLWPGTGRVCAGRVRNGLAFVPDHGDRLADRDLARLDGDLQQDAARLGFDLLRRLVGVDLEQRLALLDAVALRLQPLDDRARLHPLPEARQLHLTAHRGPFEAFQDGDADGRTGTARTS